MLTYAFAEEMYSSILCTLQWNQSSIFNSYVSHRMEKQQIFSL
jgi:hypothetical protein